MVVTYTVYTSKPYSATRAAGVERDGEARLLERARVDVAVRVEEPVVHPRPVVTPVVLLLLLRLDLVLGVARELSARIPVVLMCYSNAILARETERFVGEIAAAGVSGLIVPDLPLEEAPATAESCAAAGVAFIGLAAPTSTDQRLAAIGEATQGFLYTVAVAGTTGERGEESNYSEVIARVRSHTSAPVALGFGISTPEQASAAADAGADGVIIGSRLVREASESSSPAEDCQLLVEQFAQALR